MFHTYVLTYLSNIEIFAGSAVFHVGLIVFFIVLLLVSVLLLLTYIIFC